jgi:two-component system LytT family response regulator
MIVDDEPRARAVVRRALASHAGFKLVAECANGYEAVAAVAKFQPDFLLLDIQMPEMDGFAVLKHIKPEQLPLVVFTTAYDQYAVRAFEVHALDYLLKPFDEERFAEMIRRVEERLSEGEERLHARQVVTMLETLGATRSYPERLTVRGRGKILLVPVREIDWIEAEDNYVKIHCGSKAHLERETLSSLAERLDPKQFARVHRSVLVNVEQVQEVAHVDGEYELLVKSGARVPLSRTYRDGFLRKLEERGFSRRDYGP